MDITMNNPIKKKTPRGANKVYYHYCITEKETGDKTYYKTLKDIRRELGISASNVYNMYKNPDVDRRKYNDIKINKCHEHYLWVEYGIDPTEIFI